LVRAMVRPSRLSEPVLATMLRAAITSRMVRGIVCALMALVT